MNNEAASPNLTAMIVSSYVRHHTIGANQLSDLITSVYRTIGELRNPTQPEKALVPAVSVRRSVNPNYVVCLDCGYRGKTLRRHIAARHGLTTDEYLKRWSLPRNHRLTAPAYSDQRSQLAKNLGLGRKPAAVETRAEVPLAAIEREQNSRARLTRGRKPIVKSSNVVDQTAAATSGARRRRRPPVA
jgi:predicted transcriptional regulator